MNKIWIKNLISNFVLYNYKKIKIKIELYKRIKKRKRN